jgi:hypothetical protein
MNKGLAILSAFGILLICLSAQAKQWPPGGRVAVYPDKSYLQDYSIKYYPYDKNAVLRKIVSDRNGNVQILSDKGLLKPRAGKLLYPGALVTDLSYRPITDKKIAGLGLYEDQFVYVDDKALLSNAWAGKLYCPHQMPGARLFAGGKDFNFLISDGQNIELVNQSGRLWEGKLQSAILDIQYQQSKNGFWILTTNSLSYFSPSTKKVIAVFNSKDLTCFKLLETKALLGTRNGYLEFDLSSHKPIGKIHQRLPQTGITVIEEINGMLWFGSERGAFMLDNNGRFNYYASERWLPGDRVIDIAKGEDNTVLILTDKGLGKICFENMNLYKKAMYYEEQVRQRHIRYGFYCDYVRIQNGDVSTAALAPHDSDNLWTSMYLVSQLFRWLVTHEAEARQNCLESFEAMERLHTIQAVPGFFGRSFERSGIAEFKDEHRKNVENYWYPGYAHTPSSWHHATDEEWDWRGASSSDQTVGQFFALTLVAQYMDDENMKQRAIQLIDRLTGHIVDSDLKLIDYDGRPTLWGIWNPEYVNRFPEMVGDRKLYSSNIISFLQTAYHFTGKEKYKDKAMELLYKNGYLKNLMRPVSQIGKAPENADNWSKELSGGWNDSDDEMYFLAYWGLYPYAFNDTLKEQYRQAIKDHWNFKRPDKDGLWNLCYAMTGDSNFDLHETIWYLKEMPLDLINWNIHNSDRKDLVFIE